MAGGIPVSERRIVLVGRRGIGKSATGNTILGRKVFKSRVSRYSVTQACQREQKHLNGRRVVVVDTPGFPLNKHPKESSDITAEVSKCVRLCSPGPHVFLWVMRDDIFTQYEKDVAQLIKNIFGLKAKDYVIILFAHKDELQGVSLESIISAQDENLQEYVAECGNRLLAFNNKAKGKEREAQVAKLMAMIDDLVETNSHAPCFTEDLMKVNKRRKF